MNCPKPIRGPEFQLSKMSSAEFYWEQAVSVPAPLNSVYICIAMARRDAWVKPYQFDPELDPEGEAPEEVQTL